MSVVSIYNVGYPLNYRNNIAHYSNLLFKEKSKIKSQTMNMLEYIQFHRKQKKSFSFQLIIGQYQQYDKAYPPVTRWWKIATDVSMFLLN